MDILKILKDNQKYILIALLGFVVMYLIKSITTEKFNVLKKVKKTTKSARKSIVSEVDKTVGELDKLKDTVTEGSVDALKAFIKEYITMLKKINSKMGVLKKIDPKKLNEKLKF